MLTDHQREMLEQIRENGQMTRRPRHGPEIKTHADIIRWIRNTGIKPLGTLKSLKSQGLVRCVNYPEKDWWSFPDDSVWEITEKAAELLTDTRTSPLNAAWVIAKREGFAAVTRERIARECGLSTGSVSHLLGGMDPIYQHILDRAHKENVRLKYK